MRRLAETDSLTGLPNRHLIIRTIRRKLQRADPVGHFALLSVDLNDFKRINDSLGHHAGDELLKRVARRLARTVGGECLVARVGGDEFLIVIDDPNASTRASNLADAVIEGFIAPFGLMGNNYTMQVSIGIAVYLDASQTESDLLTHADLAMYAAKQAAKTAHASRTLIYTPDLSERAARRLERQRELHSAIANQEFYLEYQPIICLETGRLTGAEALVRWMHPQKGLIMPGEFIPFAESAGFIIPIGQLVFEMACKELADWRCGDGVPYLAVNVSAAQLGDRNFVRFVRTCLSYYGIDAGRLHLEITETAMLDVSEVVKQQLEELRAIGIRIVLDDFGTGYSSLSHLSSLMIDGIKVDRSFTQGLPGNRAAAATLKSIVSLTGDLGLSLVVEGVETKDQAQWLREFGEIEVQGFYFSRPVPVDALRAVAFA